MEKTVKILIVVCIILICGFGLTIGMLLEKNSNIASAQNNSNVNQSVQTSSDNSGQKTNNSPVNSQKTNYIGKAAAKQKAIEFLTDRDSMDTTEIKSVDLVTINGVPLYCVETYDHYITYSGTEAGWDDIYIGAKDGMIYDDYGERVTT